MMKCKRYILSLLALQVVFVTLMSTLHLLSHVGGEEVSAGHSHRHHGHSHHHHHDHGHHHSSGDGLPEDGSGEGDLSEACWLCDFISHTYFQVADVALVVDWCEWQNEYVLALEQDVVVRWYRCDGARGPPAIA